MLESYKMLFYLLSFYIIFLAGNSLVDKSSLMLYFSENELKNNIFSY